MCGASAAKHHFVLPTIIWCEVCEVLEVTEKYLRKNKKNWKSLNSTIGKRSDKSTCKWTFARKKCPDGKIIDERKRDGEAKIPVFREK